MVMMKILQAVSQLSENIKKSEITADFCKLNKKSELKLSLLFCHIEVKCLINLPFFSYIALSVI